MDPKIYLLREFQEFELAEKWINAKAKDPDRYKLHSIIKHGGLLIVVLIYCADEPRNKREFERDLCDYLTTEKGRAIVHKLLFEALTNKEKQIQRTLENAEDLKSVGEEEV